MCLFCWRLIQKQNHLALFIVQIPFLLLFSHLREVQCLLCRTFLAQEHKPRRESAMNDVSFIAKSPSREKNLQCKNRALSIGPYTVHAQVWPHSSLHLLASPALVRSYSQKVLPKPQRPAMGSSASRGMVEVSGTTPQRGSDPMLVSTALTLLSLVQSCLWPGAPL